MWTRSTIHHSQQGRLKEENEERGKEASSVCLLTVRDATRKRGRMSEQRGATRSTRLQFPHLFAQLREAPPRYVERGTCLHTLCAAYVHSYDASVYVSFMRCGKSRAFERRFSRSPIATRLLTRRNTRYHFDDISKYYYLHADTVASYSRWIDCLRTQLLNNFVRLRDVHKIFFVSRSIECTYSSTSQFNLWYFALIRRIN